MNFLLATVIAAAPSMAEPEARQFQGVWRAEGKREVVIDGSKMLLFGNPATYTLDPTKSPKQIDIRLSKFKLVGIYAVEGDSLKLCFDLDERPRQFADKNGGPSLVIFKRTDKGPQGGK